jgi:hypothetical protein
VGRSAQALAGVSLQHRSRRSPSSGPRPWPRPMRVRNRSAGYPLRELAPNRARGAVGLSLPPSPGCRNDMKVCSSRLPAAPVGRATRQRRGRTPHAAWPTGSHCSPSSKPCWASGADTEDVLQGEPRPGHARRLPGWLPDRHSEAAQATGEITRQPPELPELRQGPQICRSSGCRTRKHSPPLPRTPLTCSYGPDSHRATAGSVRPAGPIR